MHRQASICVRGVVVCLLATVTANAQTRADWPRWRGPNGDGVGLDSGLLKEWPKGGPEVVWEVDAVGEGYSSVAVKGDRILTQGSVDGIDKILALDAKDGSTIWAVQPEAIAGAARERVQRAMLRGDTNGDGRLEEAEMLKIVGWDINQAEKPSEGDAKQVAEARVERLLAALDKDGDGLLGRGEAGRGFERTFGRIDRQSRGEDAASLPKKRTEALLEEFDKNGNRELDQEEMRGTWVRVLSWRADQRDPETRRGDGVLTAAELEGYFQKREPGRDGLLSTEELQAYYERRLPKRDGIYTETDLWGVYGGYRHGIGNGPRGTPTIDGSRVYVQGGNGDVSCLDFATGKTIWHVSLTKDMGGKVPGWGYSESPLVHGDMVLVTPGGSGGTVAALSKGTGEVLWRSTDVTEAATYSTVVATTIGGIPQLVQFANENVFGLTMDTGRLLWKYSHQRAKQTINITTPIVSQDHVLVSSAYGNGTGLAKITTADGQQSAAEVYFRKELDNHHGGIVKVGDYVYGFGSRELMCMHFLTGEIAWKDRSVGKGSLTMADGMLYLLSERYQVGLAEATPEEYREHGRFKIDSHGRPSWAHPVVAGGRLYIRNQHVLTAYNVSAD